MSNEKCQMTSWRQQKQNKVNHSQGSLLGSTMKFCSYQTFGACLTDLQLYGQLVRQAMRHSCRGCWGFSCRPLWPTGKGNCPLFAIYSVYQSANKCGYKQKDGVDLSDGQVLIVMRCRCFLCDSDAMSMVFGHSYHLNRYDYFCSTIGTDYFPMFFSNLRTDVWRWFCGKTPKQRILRHAQIRDILCVY